MSRTTSELFHWQLKAPDRRRRINRLRATLNDPDLERQFRTWHWKDRRRTGGTALAFLTLIIIVLTGADIALNGLTDSTLSSLAWRAPVVVMSLFWIALGRRNTRPHHIDWTTVAVAVAIGACLTAEHLQRGIPWDGLVVPAVTAVVIFTLFLRQPFSLTILSLAALLVPFTASLFLTGADIPDIAACVMLYVAVGFCLQYMRQIAIVSRDYFLQNNQLEEMATELDDNMKTATLEHQALERAATENAALADELALSRMAAEENAYYLENILENVAQGVVVLDKDLRITKFNSAYVELAGIPPHLAKAGTHISEIVQNALDRGLYVDEETRKGAVEAIERPDGLLLKGPVVLERAQGNGRYVEVRRNPLPDGGEVSTYTDITERRRADEIMRAQAMRDPLTDLSNRLHYAERLDDALARSKRSGLYVALACLDLDRFKPVNDTYGHATGDAVLRRLANIFRAHVREVDTVARLGGDEFVIIFDGVRSMSDVTTPIERIMKAAAKPFTVCGIEINIGISAGVSVFPIDARTADGLLDAADRALYEAKNSGRGCCRMSGSEYQLIGSGAAGPGAVMH